MPFIARESCQPRLARLGRWYCLGKGMMPAARPRTFTRDTKWIIRTERTRSGALAWRGWRISVGASRAGSGGVYQSLPSSTPLALSPHKRGKHDVSHLPRLMLDVAGAPVASPGTVSTRRLDWPFPPRNRNSACSERQPQMVLHRRCGQDSRGPSMVLTMT